MKTKNLCPCGSGKAKESCCEQSPQIRIWGKDFNNDPEESQNFLKALQISREFSKRYRRLHEYYGKDFIAFKLAQPIDKSRDEFLGIISRFMAEYLKDDCPPSWSECQPTFWEELICTILPHCMKLTREEKEVERFISELKSFVRMIDTRNGTSWFKTVNEYILEFYPELEKCERLLNHLTLRNYPNIHEENFNVMYAIQNSVSHVDSFTETHNSLFEISSIIDDIVVLTHLDTEHPNFDLRHRKFQVNNLPINLVMPGLVLDGTIGKNSDDMFWNWCFTGGVYPQKGPKYIKIVG